MTTIIRTPKPKRTKRIETAILTRTLEEVLADTSLAESDRRAELDRILVEYPKPALPSEFEVTEHVIPPARRIVAISGGTLHTNSDGRQPAAHWPVIEIFEDPREEGLRGPFYPKVVTINGYHMFRHVQILGPSQIVHDPVTALENSPRRIAFLATSAAMRVYIDENGPAAPVYPDTTNGKKRFGC